MRRDYQVHKVMTNDLQQIIQEVTTIERDIHQALFEECEQDQQISHFTERLSLKKHTRYTIATPTLYIQAYIHKTLSSIQTLNSKVNERRRTYIQRFCLNEIKSLNGYQITQAQDMIKMLNELMNACNKWPSHIKNQSLMGRKLINLKNSLAWGLQATATKLIHERIMKQVRELLSWNHTYATIIRIRADLERGMLSEKRAFYEHQHLLTFIKDLQECGKNNQIFTKKQHVVKKWLNRADVCLALDKMSLICHKLQTYLQKNGLMQKVIIWAFNQTKLSNITRILCELQYLIEKIKSWSSIEHEIKRKIRRLEKVITKDLENNESDMSISLEVTKQLYVRDRIKPL